MNSSHILSAFKKPMTDNLAGTFKCFNHNFSTSEPEQWQKHIADKEHTYTGEAECVTCGDRVKLNWTGKLHNRTTPNVLCEDCKAQ